LANFAVLRFCPAAAKIKSVTAKDAKVAQDRKELLKDG